MKSHYFDNSTNEGTSLSNKSSISNEVTTTNDITFTIDDAISHIGIGRFQYELLYGLIGMVWAADAMEVMLLSFLVTHLKNDWNLKSPWDGSIAAVVFLGMFSGAFVWSIISDRIGRRRIIIFSNLGTAIFGTLSAFAPNIIVMLAFRFVVGFCVAGSAVAYTLFAEYSPKHKRGFMLMIQQIFWSIGALFVVLVAWLTLSLLNWRWFLIFCSIPIWIVVLFYKFIPESPRYLLTSNRRDEAMDLLRKVSIKNGVGMPNGTLALDPELEHESRGKISDIFVPMYRYASILLFVTFWLCVFGYYGIVFVSERFFKKHGGHGNGAQYWEMLVTTSSELPSVVIGALILDKIGRKISMMACFSIFTVCTFLLIIGPITNNIVASVTFIFLGRLSISLGFAALYVYFSEYYPTAIRTTSLGTASSLGRIAGVITSFVSEDLSVNNAMIIYSIGGLIATVCCILLPIDLTGKELKNKVDRSDADSVST